jgi:predicted nucleic acid-binding protein
MNVVVDASVAIKWFVQEDLHEHALNLLDRGDDLHAPDLLIPEVANVAWKKCIRGEVARKQAETIIGVSQGYVPHLHPSKILACRALDLAIALNHPVYDCLYLACAERADGIVVTADERFVTACMKSDNTPRILLLGTNLTALQ